MISRLRAQEIVEELAQSGLVGGSLAYNPDGSGGEWYKDGTYGLGPGVVVIRAGKLYGVDDILARFAGSEQSD